MAVTAPPSTSAPGGPTAPGGAAGPGAPAGQPPAEPPRPPHTWQVLTRATRAWFEGTPGRLRVAGIATVLACLLFGVFAFVAASTRAGALADARADATQLVRVQTIHTNLVSADANLTNAFLVGGLEPPAARTAYQDGIATAAKTLADASGNNTSDAATLAEVNDVVTQYTGLVESARANNRLGYPLGAAYLREATNLLRSDALPQLETLGRSVQDRIDHAYSASADAAAWLVAGLLVALVVLIVAQVWLAGRTRRLFNLPLVAATAIVLVVGIVLAGVMWWAQDKAKNTRSDAYFSTLALTTARADAFDAKSSESLTLIARGQGQPYEQRFQNEADNAQAILARASGGGNDDIAAAAKAFQDYRTVHKQIRAKDDAGDWDAAVALATGSGPDTANAAFQKFNDASGQALQHTSTQLRRDLDDAHGPLPVFAWIALVAGIAAAVAAGWGISVRMREYR
ncbi:MAG TPA: hypothetical protein VH373_11075 [Jatrophihabitantaceae bacterium]